MSSGAFLFLLGILYRQFQTAFSYLIDFYAHYLYNDVRELLYNCFSDIYMDYSAELYHAVVDNDIDKLQLLLRDGANPNEFYEDMAKISSKYLLHICASRGNLECARLLVENGAYILARDSWYMTPILHAAISNRHHVIEYLISACPEAADAGDKFGKRPLHVAVEYDSVETVEVLLQGGAYVNSSTEHGFTPLMALCSSSDIEHREELMRLLLDAGAYLEQKETGSLRTALQVHVYIPP